MSRQPAMFALTVPSTTRQSHDVISPEKTMPRPTTSLRVAVSDLVGCGAAGCAAVAGTDFEVNMMQRLHRWASGAGRIFDCTPAALAVTGGKFGTRRGPRA